MFRGPAYTGRSKATPTTTCQNYECKASAQERPYVSRPSRTQQLFNPKLKPQLTSDVPNDLLRKKGVADETLASKADERGRKHSREDEDLQHRPRKRSRSASAYSSSSVPTISTNRSPSRSPPPARQEASKRSRRSPAGDDRKRRRRSVSSSAGSYHTDRDDRPRAKERNTRRRRSSFSPGERGRPRSRSFVSNHNDASRSGSRRRSPSRDFERSISPYSQRARVPRLSPPRRPRSRSPRRRANPELNGPPSDRPHRPPPGNAGPPPASNRERSLSPYSKRLALTQSMNMGGR
ncbi:hypothetical protein BK809_0004674 [Diplodia seriata]|uniref:Uncharacterized protein n=1 Tax=Diplodia seriata TaxID=420778 RepID=A0A1S8B7B3_9PEZI|nr:hypothetical protein BK809_0004674 [Diplodia seriata]